MDAGTASVMGHDLRREGGAVRAVIGVTGQFSAVDDLLTGEENLLLTGRLLHLPAAERRVLADRLLERFDLVEVARRTPATYSGGTKHRLDIAMTLRLRFADAASLDAAARALCEGTRDDEALMLRVPDHGGLRSLRDVLAASATASPWGTCRSTLQTSTTCS